jgi:hypothetical protein
MIDWLTPDGRALYDLKTSAASFAPHVINRKMVDDGWDIQAAMHERAMNALDPMAPAAASSGSSRSKTMRPTRWCRSSSETWLTMGRKKLDGRIRMWREAIKSGPFCQLSERGLPAGLSELQGNRMARPRGRDRR